MTNKPTTPFRVFARIASLMVLVPATVCAQSTNEVPTETETESMMSVMQIIETGGWPMMVLGLMSVVGVALVLYFFVTLRQAVVIPPNYAADLQTHLLQGKMDIARRVSSANRSPAASIAAVAMEYTHNSTDPNPGLLKELIEGEGGRQAVLLQTQTQYLLDIGVISPMVGLLGTVFGMLRAFNAVALDIAQAKPMMLAAGVSQALITTAAGLIVGIPAMLFYAYFRGRTSKIIAQLESFSSQLLTLLVDRERV